MKATLEWMSDGNSQQFTRLARVGRAHLRHYTVSYKEWGHGRPLILVPGLAGGIDLVEPLARELARDFRVISYQLRGEEDPFALRQRFGLADLVRDLDELLGCFRVERPIVVGLSFGGALALEHAARHPYRVEKLIVQGVGAKLEDSLLQWVAGQVLSGYPLPTDNPFLNQFFNLFFGGKGQPQELRDRVTRLCWQTDQSIMAHRFKMVQRFDVRKKLSRIAAPTLVLHGKRDLLVSEKSLKALRHGLPTSEVVELDGCGHLAFTTHPRCLADEVRWFAR